MASSTCLRVSRYLIGVAGLWAIASVEAADQAILRLTNGDHVAGQLADSLQADFITWRSPAFTGPMQFALSGVSAINFPVPENAPKPAGDYCVEFIDGDVLFGSLVKFEADEAILVVPPLGNLHVSKSHFRRMYRWNGGNELIFFGPSGLAGWETSGPDAEWREETGRLMTKGTGAAIRRNFKLPPQVRFEFELSWTGKPDFEFALGIDGQSSAQSYRFEIWENDLVVMRETELEADVTSLASVKSGTGNIQLNAFLDQTAERLLVYSSNGEKLADLKVTSRKPRAMSGIQLKNGKGNIRLERLRICQWNGELPRAVQADKTRIHLTDGSIAYGQLKSYDATRREFQIDDETSSKTIPADRVSEIILSQRSDSPDQKLRLMFVDGQQVGGDLEKIENGVVWLKCQDIREALAVPVGSLQSMVVTLQKPEAPDLPGRQGRLELDGVHLNGCLVDGNEKDAGSLVWQSLYGRSSSALVPGISARIIYRDAPPVIRQQPGQENVVPNGRARVVGVVALDAMNATPTRTRTVPKINAKNSIPVLHLRSGDKLPCTVVGVDENGITIKSSVTDATFIKHDQIKVLELIPEAPPVAIAAVKRKRLLVLPRMQRDNPPTQLIRSTSGDYLRGRLVALTEDEVKFELRLEEKVVPRDIVARIIWLHADEVDGIEKSTAKQSTTESMRVQAVPRDGNRLTFLANQVEGMILSGRSEILGGCRIDLQKIDQLLVGAAIEHAAAALEFHQWRLQQAIDPLGAADESEGGGEGPEGRDAALVGKHAPDIKLNLLNGTKFRLADHRNKIVVLDFWASWCGPCLQAMPQVDSVAREFVDKNVMLVAINLEEAPDKVKAALERLKLETTVALDRNGRVSERYGVTAIPQTVIIDGDGKVVRVFVGGGARFGDQVRAALQNVIADPAGKASEDPPANK